MGEFSEVRDLLGTLKLSADGDVLEVQHSLRLPALECRLAWLRGSGVQASGELTAEGDRIAAVVVKLLQDANSIIKTSKNKEEFHRLSGKK